MMDMGKSKVMRCSTYVNVRRWLVRLNGEPFEEVDCFKNLGSRVTVDGGCERNVIHSMNEGHKAWGALKSVQ